MPCEVLRSASMASFVPSLLILFLVLVCHALSPASASSLTAPAFIWSDHRSFGSETQGAVDYRVFSPLTLVDALMQKFGWSNLLCASHDRGEEKVDAVMAFIGNQLRVEDLSRDASGDNFAVLTTLKELFSSSNYSTALPYVSIPVEGPGIVNMLVSAIKNSCDLKSRSGKTLIVGPCLRQMFDPKWPILTEGLELVENAEDVKEFIYSRKASRMNSETDIIVACPTLDVGPKEAESEGVMLATILSALRQSGTSNAVLYASDPLAASSPYKYHGRFLALNANSSNSTCDEVCETIAGVYEGVIVAITLLIILISGLCCMMGIDTPARFETSQDS